jgi:hypothetical protein
MPPDRLTPGQLRPEAQVRCRQAQWNLRPQWLYDAKNCSKMQDHGSGGRKDKEGRIGNSGDKGSKPA